jgi:hypothetical protein
LIIKHRKALKQMASSEKKGMDLGPPLDLIAQLSGCEVVVLFPNGRAAGVFDALAMIPHVDRYETGQWRGKVYHSLGFVSIREQAPRVVLACRAVGGLAGVKIFIRGQELGSPYYLFASTVECFVASLRCDDYRAHCHRVIEIKAGKRIDELGFEHAITRPYVFPCNVIMRSGETHKLALNHPASLRDQAQALAVSAGCDWCPRFDPDAFRPLSSIDAEQPTPKLT